MRKIYMIGNTHFDPVWLWKWDEAMASIRATFRSALDRMEEDENFIYSFCTPPVFDWIKNTDPEMFEEIKWRVKEGRWDIAEGWWVQPDCYSACGESYVRQSLYGQKYLFENFGKISECVFNIDSFGHSPNLPQILKKSHISYYCFVRPEKHHIPLCQPLFYWEGADGSKLLTYRAEEAYSKDLSECMEKQEEKEQDILIVYGVTDHGDAPTKKMISEINAMKNTEFSSVARFFKEHTDCTYTFSDELLTGDFGVYANFPEIKKYNRLAEYAVLNAEKSSVIAKNYDNEKIENCWHDILFNQFHDILGGASIKDAYFDAENSFGRAIQTANEIMHFNLQKLTAKMKTVGKNPDDIWNLVIWNLNGSDFCDYLEAEVQWAHEFDWYDKGIALEDSDGNTYPCQVIDSKSVIPRFRSRFVFKADIPSVGYKMFKVVKTNTEEAQNKIDPYNFSTSALDIKFAKDGALTVKCASETIFCDILKPVCYFDDGDTWAFNIDGYSEKREEFDFCGLSVIESGKIRTVIKATYKFKASILKLYYTFYENEKNFDVKYIVNWNEKHYVLKLETKTDSDIHTAGAPYARVTRKCTKADVPMSEWVSAGKVSFICDSIFAYNMIDKTLGLTVLRSPIFGDLRIGDIDYDHEYEIMSQGITEGNIRITANPVDFTDADNFINKPIIIDECNHNGELSAENSYFKVSGDGIYLGALKKCEFDDSYIIRIFESTGKEHLAEIHFEGALFKTSMKPYEIKTLKFKDGNFSEIYITEEGETKC